MQPMRTRGEMLAQAISFALGNAVKVVRGCTGLMSNGRYAAANGAVEEMEKRDDPWRLSEEVKWEGPPPAKRDSDR
jgi:hypothetical protein